MEPLKEDHLRSCGLQAEWGLYRQQASEVSLKGIEQRERFKRIHVVEVAAEADGVFAVLPGYVVNDLRAALLIKIRIAPIHARGESVEHLQVRLRVTVGKSNV